MRAWKLIVIISVVVIMAISTIGVGLLGYEYWRRGQPEYSISQIGVAIETHDLQLFRKHVDVRSVTSRLIDDLNVQDQKTDSLSVALVEVLKPQLITQMSDQVERFVETGKFDGANKTDDPLPTLHAEFQGRLGWPITQRYEGNIALVDLPVQPRNDKERTVVLGLKMRPTDDGYWQLMEVSLPKPAKK